MVLWSCSVFKHLSVFHEFWQQLFQNGNKVKQRRLSMTFNIFAPPPFDVTMVERYVTSFRMKLRHLIR